MDPVKPAKSKSRGLNDQEKAERISRIDALVGGGKTLKDAVKEAGISDQTYYLWKKALAALPEAAAPVDDEFAEFIQLEEENRRLRKLLAEKLRAENADLRRRLGMK
ncbi:transposase [Rhizobium sp. NLR15a]|uniref:transposase n=1 Tax=Rhizobium sp. NLR15a TaxID=2731111 RepID=UPI00287F5D5F|nr:transposase [Rhizobium sp. NLR15a]